MTCKDTFYKKCQVSSKKILTLILLLSFTIPASVPLKTFADQTEINQLNSQISESNKKLQELNKKIADTKAAIQSAGGRANTLQNNIAQLEASKNKILSDIEYTTTQIKSAELTLSKLDLEIGDKEKLIEHGSLALAESIRKIRSFGTTSIVERFLGYATISDFWGDFEQTEKIQKKLNSKVIELQNLHNDLVKKEIAKKTEKGQLSQYKITLSSEKESVESAKTQKATLLVRTKNEEAAYQKLLAENLRKKKKFEKELLEIESKLQKLIDPDSYPSAKKGVLAYPLDYIQITQLFGGTVFAKNNPHVYNRPFHPGVDFGTGIGTPVKAVSSGKVVGFDNTDAYPGCWAWGKWILVEHYNGLSSLYAHLSSISVSVGQEVRSGQVIGLSGNSGISTGPHLHLSVYISQGVEIGRYRDYKSGTGCSATDATGPFADLDAYLDPMLYLP